MGKLAEKLGVGNDEIAASAGSAPGAPGAGSAPSAPSDASVAAPISARPLLVAAAFTRKPRSMLVLTSGEAAADHFARELRSWLEPQSVLRLPLYTHQPWRDQAITSEHIAQTGLRSQALQALKQGTRQIIVASVESVMRRLTPAAALPPPIMLASAQALPPNTSYSSYEQLKDTLVNIGYERQDRAEGSGCFSLKGDTLDIWPASSNYPVRIEFFGDEIERIRRLVPSTGQSIGDLQSVAIFQARPLPLSESSAKRAISRLYGLKPEQLKSLPYSYSEHIEAIQSSQGFPELEMYLPFLYDQPANVLDYLHSSALVVAVEPRSLFDAASRYYDDQRQSIERHYVHDIQAQAITNALFTRAADLDFGKRQLLTLLSVMIGSSGVDLHLDVKHPAINGSEERLAQAARSYLDTGFLTIVGTADPRTRSAVELALVDAHVSFQDAANSKALPRQPIALSTELDISVSLAIPEAKLALLGINDIGASAASPAARSSSRAARAAAPRAQGSTSAPRTSARRQADPTALTFPFQPGDYVVHEVHGIALFKAIVRQEVAGVERDYLHLEYAQGDKLFTPVEQINRITRYVGPNSSSPRLTRLNTSDWSRATGKARKAAKQLAFDLVDLYSRRATVQGYSYGSDTELQYQMEAAFPYDETSDQLAAIADVKADMESTRPMDRLICGDVGFGKTEVALRAAFKAIQTGKQVLLLAPTTILAQQHYTTFFERFDPFAASVDVLSRFRTDAQQREILERFAAGRLDMLVGTHRLLSPDVNPHDLGLIIIDEEQRFGVGHKEQLKNLREQVDVLTLSATPIPRTLQMALSGVRDMSLINTPPVSRTPVKVQVGEWNEDIVSAAIRHEIGRGGQVYYVSNRVRLIDDATQRVFAAVPEAKVGVAHGQMSSRQLEDVMERFAARELDVLIATTIIESGLDNPHTNTLIIEDSQRLGLAQLYQLKGRVGRSHAQAYAYFLFPAENTLTVEAIERLMAIDEYQDLGSGMRVAMRDLEIRGAGNLLGAEQSGNMAAVGFDYFAAMINEAIQAARAGELAELDDDSSLGNAKNPKLEVRIELPEPCFFAEEYMPAADDRVMYYRRLAAATDLEVLDDLQTRLEGEYGAMPTAAANLIDRERSRVMAVELGVNSISWQRKQLVLEGIKMGPEQAAELRKVGGLYFAKSEKLQYTIPKESEAGIYPALLGLLDSLLG